MIFGSQLKLTIRNYEFVITLWKVRQLLQSHLYKSGVTPFFNYELRITNYELFNMSHWRDFSTITASGHRFLSSQKMMYFT
jgi:hypothetical protein